MVKVGLLRRILGIVARSLKVLGFCVFLLILGLDILYGAVVLNSDKIIYSSYKIAEILSVFMAECILFFISFFVFF